MKKIFEFIIRNILRREKNITEEDTIRRIAQDYAHFAKYGIDQGQVYLIRLGLYEEAISDFLFENKDSIVDYFPIKDGDYIQVLGIITKSSEKFVLFIVYDENYDRNVGNFLFVEKWPKFKNYEKKIEDSHWETFNKLKGKV